MTASPKQSQMTQGKLIFMFSKLSFVSLLIRMQEVVLIYILLEHWNQTKGILMWLSRGSSPSLGFPLGRKLFGIRFSLNMQMFFENKIKLGKKITDFCNFSLGRTERIHSFRILSEDEDDITSLSPILMQVMENADPFSFMNKSVFLWVWA